jgi:hypothetical protein
MAILYTDVTDSIIIEHTTLDEYILHIEPVFQHWRLIIIMDGFFPCDMGKCRKICKMLYDYSDYECAPLFTILADCLQDILNKMRGKSCYLSYIKRMKKNIDYIERMAKDG